MFGKDQFEWVKVGPHAFIGEGAVAMASVGEKTIVGGGSVVVKAIPPFKVVAGNPARIISDRVADWDGPYGIASTD